MSNLNAFLKPAYTERKIEVVVGDRFLNEDGTPEPIVMKSLTQEQLNQIARASTHDRKVGGRVVQEVDANEHLNRCLVESIVFPDMKSRELCRAYGTEDPCCLPTKMFLLDEFEKLAKAFAKLNGIKQDEDGMLEIQGEVTKN